MEENNDFATIVKTWRRLSGSQVQIVTNKQLAPSMSGDSSNHPVPNKIEEESSLLVPDKASAVIGGVGAASVLQDPQPDASTETDTTGNQDEFTTKEIPKEAAGDSINDKNSDYLENNEKVIREPPTILEKEKLADNVDSVFLKPPPAHKTRSSTPTPEDESCGIKCLYYTLQCCDCVLM